MRKWHIYRIKHVLCREYISGRGVASQFAALLDLPHACACHERDDRIFKEWTRSGRIKPLR